MDPKSYPKTPWIHGEIPSQETLNRVLENLELRQSAPPVSLADWKQVCQDRAAWILISWARMLEMSEKMDRLREENAKLRKTI